MLTSGAKDYEGSPRLESPTSGRVACTQTAIPALEDARPSPVAEKNLIRPSIFPLMWLYRSTIYTPLQFTCLPYSCLMIGCFLFLAFVIFSRLKAILIQKKKMEFDIRVFQRIGNDVP